MRRGRGRLEIRVTKESEEEQNGRRKSPKRSTNLFHFHPPTHVSRRSHQEILMGEKKNEGGKTAREEREWKE